jgi:glutathione S-transferase
MEPWVSSTELNSLDFVLPKDQHVPAIIQQNSMMFRRSAAALEEVLGRTAYLVEGRFTVTDIIVGYTINFGHEQGLVSEFPNLMAYLKRLYQREHCTLVRYG